MTADIGRRLHGSATFESEPNDAIAMADSLASGRVAGAIDPAGDVDVYAFTANANEAMAFQVVCQNGNGFFDLDQFGSATELIVTIRDAMGVALTSAQIDDPANGGIEANGVGWFVPPEAEADQSAAAPLTAAGYRPVVSVTVPADYRPEGVSSVMAELADPVESHLRLVEPCD